ncbi:MAG: hypothetical protein RL272_1180 [Candidatus Parcubacteria bacterium]
MFVVGVAVVVVVGMSNPQNTEGLTAEQGLELIRSLPEREDNLSNAELDWLDERGMWTTGDGVEGHEDISLIDRSAAADFLILALDTERERAASILDDEIAAADFGTMPVNSPAAVAHSTLVNLRHRLFPPQESNQEGAG